MKSPNHPSEAEETLPEETVRDLHQDLRTVLRQLARALSDVVKGVSVEIKKPVELQRALRLDSKLCWQIFNVIRKHDSLATAQHVPGPPSAKRFLAAAAETGVAESQIAKAQQAFARFSELVAEHGPDRATFDTLAMAASPAEDSAGVDLYHRRNAYKSESHIWGVQVDTYITAALIHPSEVLGKKDECSLTVRVGQRRLRSDAPVVVHRMSSHMSFKQISEALRQPLDAEAAEALNAPLLPAFCSDPLPPMRSRLLSNGSLQVEVQGGMVGRKAAFDLAFGGILRNLDYSLDDNGRRVLRQSVSFITPASLVYMDMLVHRDIARVLEPKMQVLARPNTIQPPSLHEQQTFSVHGEISRIHIDSPDLPIEEYSAYPELLEYACSALNWRLSDFTLYRLRLPYPILNSVVHIEARIE